MNDDQELFIKRTNSPTFSEIPQFTYFDGMDQLPVMEYVVCDRVCSCNLLGDLWVGFFHHTCIVCFARVKAYQLLPHTIPYRYVQTSESPESIIK